MNGIKGRTLIGLAWNISERVGRQAIMFIPTVVLARLLRPEQFGLIGMLTLFTLVATAFLDGGYGVALVQKKDLTYADECSVFYFNLAVGALLTAALFFSAPLLADFFHQPALENLARVLSLTVLIKAFGLVQSARLTRAMDFKTLLKASLAGAVVSGTIGVAAAHRGLGVWSLVAQIVANDLVGTAALWTLCAWRPALQFSAGSLKGMFGYGSRMLAANLLETVSNNLNRLLIGRYFSAAALGYFTRAASLRMVVTDATSDTLGRVMFPALASIQDDRARLRRAYRTSIVLVTFVNFPLMAGLIVVAGPLFTLLFTDAWAGAVPFFQLMCCAGLLHPLHMINLDVLRVTGRSDLYFRLSFVKRLLMIAMIFLTYRLGISAMLIGQIVVSAGTCALNGYYTDKLIDYSLKDQARDVLPTFAASALMAGSMVLAGALLRPASGLALMCAQVLVGAAVYALTGLALKSAAVAEIIALRKLLGANT